MYLLDTSFLSELARTPPDPGVVTWLAQQRRTDMAISSLSIAEITRGIARLGASRRAESLSEWFEEVLSGELFERVVAFGIEEARAWGHMRALADRSGQPLPVVDSLIAATALHHDLTVVTRNVRDFERCGVAVLSPWSGG